MPQHRPIANRPTAGQLDADADYGGALARALGGVGDALLGSALTTIGLPVEALSGAGETGLTDSQALYRHPAGYYHREKLLPRRRRNYALIEVLFGGVEKPVFTTDSAHNHLITLAEVLVVTILAVLVLAVELGRIPAWPVIIILARELAVTALRNVAAGKGVLIRASGLGKTKMVAQVTAVLMLMLSPVHPALRQPGLVVLWVVVLLTLWSGADYFVRFWRDVVRGPRAEPPAKDTLPTGARVLGQGSRGSVLQRTPAG